MTPVIFVKWGGSLITDKRRRRRARRGVLARLAGELARARMGRRVRIVLGHGSGSFGHVEAARYRLADGLSRAAQLPGVARTQLAARELHGLVIEALARCGLAPISIAPSGFLQTSRGRPRQTRAAPLWTAVDHGLLPVVFGDVVVDLERGVSICATETVFHALHGSLRRRPDGRLARVVWLGETDGILDATGRTVPRVGPADAAAVRRMLGPPAGTDVTGGMRLRLDTALAFARRGIESWILDGTRRGTLERAIAGRPAGGTRVTPV